MAAVSRLDQLLADARDRKRRLDAMDRGTGLATPIEVSDREVISTAQAAIKCALARGDLAIAADAYVLLDELLERGN